MLAKSNLFWVTHLTFYLLALDNTPRKLARKWFHCMVYAHTQKQQRHRSARRPCCFHKRRTRLETLSMTLPYTNHHRTRTPQTPNTRSISNPTLNQPLTNPNQPKPTGVRLNQSSAMNHIEGGGIAGYCGCGGKLDHIYTQILSSASSWNHQHWCQVHIPWGVCLCP